MYPRKVIKGELVKHASKLAHCVGTMSSQIHEYAEELNVPMRFPNLREALGKHDIDTPIFSLLSTLYNKREYLSEMEAINSRLFPTTGQVIQALYYYTEMDESLNKEIGKFHISVGKNLSETLYTISGAHDEGFILVEIYSVPDQSNISLVFRNDS